MKYICYVCDCGCHFAVDAFSDNEELSCPVCVSDWNITATGECMIDPKIEPNRSEA